ncbi:MAG: hypothetical protein R3C49_08350 [Planctomycetaceae bacterium]
MKAIISIAVVAGGFLMWVAWTADRSPVNAQQTDPPAAKQADDKAELSEFMRKKLTASNRILEGLMVNDLDMVAAGGDELLKMSESERWRASNDMMYLQHSREFRSAVEAMILKAEKRSIDGAALKWVDVTMNCIKCHEWVRDVMVADLRRLPQTPSAVDARSTDR